jgi:hypothetical protein
VQEILQAPATKTAPFNGAALDVSALETSASLVVRLHVTKLTPTSAALLQLQHCPDTTAQTPVWTPAAAPRKRPWWKLPDGRDLKGFQQDSGPGTQGRNPPPPGTPKTRYPQPFGPRPPKTQASLTDAARPTVDALRRKINQALDPMRRASQRRPPGRP